MPLFGLGSPAGAENDTRRVSNAHVPGLKGIREPGILSLPLAKLLPFCSLWTMHVWIFWFNRTSLRQHIASVPWWLSIYGVMTFVLVVTAILFLLKSRSGTGIPAGSRRGLPGLDVAMTVLMCATTASIGIAGTVGTSLAGWVAANAVSAGICMTWGYLRWSLVFADLGIRDAVACLFGSYLLGSTVKVFIVFLGEPWSCMFAFVFPLVSLLSLTSVRKTDWVPQHERRGTVLYRSGQYSPLAPIAVCVFVFCLVRRLSSASSFWVVGAASMGPVSHIIEILFSVAVLFWVFGLNRSISFFQLWRFVFLFAATALVVSATGLRAYIGDLFGGVSMSLIVMLLWLLLSDVAHHSDSHPFVIFGFGWGLYVGSQFLGSALLHVSPLAGLGTEAGPVLAVVLIWVMGIAMVFCSGTDNPDTRRIFDDMNNRPLPEEYVTVDRRCEELGKEHGLTERELDVLKLLVRGRSKGFIAEELCITENTVRAHSRRLYAKLDVHRRDELHDLLGF